jgi:hypothetical protein
LTLKLSGEVNDIPSSNSKASKTWLTKGYEITKKIGKLSVLLGLNSGLAFAEEKTGDSSITSTPYITTNSGLKYMDVKVVAFK